MQDLGIVVMAGFLAAHLQGASIQKITSADVTSVSDKTLIRKVKQVLYVPEGFELAITCVAPNNEGIVETFLVTATGSLENKEVSVTKIGCDLGSKECFAIRDNKYQPILKREQLIPGVTIFGMPGLDYLQTIAAEELYFDVTESRLQRLQKVMSKARLYVLKFPLAPICALAPKTP